MNFNRSLAYGRRFEQLLADCFPTKLELLDGRLADLLHKPSGFRLEVKTESRSLDETERYYVERWSNNGKTDGGAWQARGKGVELFGFFFPRSFRLHLFKTDRFVARAEQYLERRPRLLSIPSTAADGSTYYTLGLPAPRDFFADLLVADIETDRALTAAALAA